MKKKTEFTVQIRIQALLLVALLCGTITVSSAFQTAPRSLLIPTRPKSSFLQRSSPTTTAWAKKTSSSSTSKTLKTYEPKKSVASFLIQQLTASSAQDERSAVESTVSTAQLLMDPKRQNELKKRLKQQYPLLPDGAIDAALQLTSEAFQKATPKELQAALKPGGYAKSKPKLVALVVEQALKLDVVKDVPLLTEQDKRDLLTALVDNLVDLVFADSQHLLQAPEVRLGVLEAQVAKVKREMGWWRLTKYRIASNPVTVASMVTAAGLLLASHQHLHIQFVRSATAAAKLIISNLWNAIATSKLTAWAAWLGSVLGSAAGNMLSLVRG